VVANYANLRVLGHLSNMNIFYLRHIPGRPAAVSRGAVGGAGKLLAGAVGRQAAKDKGVTTVERPGDGMTVHGEHIGATHTVQVQHQQNPQVV
jgi:hypothetical protein